MKNRKYYRLCGYSNYTREEAYLAWGLVVLFIVVYSALILLAAMT